MDTEQSNLVISKIGSSSFVFVRKELEYKQISQLKIITNLLPMTHSQVEKSYVELLLNQIKQITSNKLLMVANSVILNSYD